MEDYRRLIRKEAFEAARAGIKIYPILDFSGDYKITGKFTYKSFEAYEQENNQQKVITD